MDDYGKRFIKALNPDTKSYAQSFKNAMQREPVIPAPKWAEPEIKAPSAPVIPKTPDQQIMEQDFAEINKMPQDARKAFDEFIQYKNGGRNIASNMARSTQSLNKLIDMGYKPDDIQRWAESAIRQMNAEEMQKVQSEAQSGTEKGFLPAVGHNVAATLRTPLGALTGAVDAVNEALQRAVMGSRYKTMDPNLPGYRNSAYAQTVRGTSRENIDEKSKALGYLYSAGTQAVDSSLRFLALGPAGSMALVGADAYQNAVRDASANGGSDIQAQLKGVTNAAIEALTEKIPINSLLGLKGSDRGFIRSILMQGISELGEEEVGFVADLVTDALIMGENSDFNREISERIADGESEEEAKKNAIKSKVWEAGETAIESFLSGAIMGGAEEAHKAYKQRNSPPSDSTTQQETPVVEPVEPVREEAKSVPDNNTIDSQPTANQELPESNVGNIENGQEKSKSPVLESVREAYRESGKVTNKQAEEILNDSEAIQELFPDVELPETNSEKRNAVKEAVAKLEALPDVSLEDSGIPKDDVLTEPVTEYGEQARRPEDLPEDQATSVGAADAGFTGKYNVAYNDMLTDENAMPDRKDDVRPMEVPKKLPDGRKNSASIGNVYGSKAMPDSYGTQFEKLTVEGAFAADPLTNLESYTMAQKEIDRDGEQKTITDIHKAVESGRINTSDITKSQILLAKALNGGDTEKAAELFVDFTELARASGRNLQLFKLFRKLTPEGQLMAVQKSAQRYVDSMNKGRSKKDQVEMKIPESLETEFKKASGDALKVEGEAKNSVSEKIQKGMEEDIEEAAEEAAEKAEDTIQEKVAKRVVSELQKLSNDRKISEDEIIFQDIMKFAQDEIRKAREKSPVYRKVPGRTALDTVADYYRNKKLFQESWDLAEEKVREKIKELSASSEPIDNEVSEILSDYLRGTMPDKSGPLSVFRKGVKIAADKAGVKMANKKPGNTTFRKELVDVLGKGAKDTEAAVQAIARVVTKHSGATGEEALEIAWDVRQAFMADLSERSKARLDQIFTKRKAPEKVQKTAMQKLEEMYNLGAFSSKEYADQISDYVFGIEGVEIPSDLAAKYAKAEQNKAEIEENIYEAVAAQMPGTLKEKWDAWRHMAMLGNFKTQVRNVAGNVAMKPFTFAKRAVGTALEKTLISDKSKRTKSLGISKELMELAKADIPNAESLLEGNSKTGDEARSKISEKRRIFKNKALESARAGLYGAMEFEDAVFKHREYAVSLASFLKARGFTAKQWRSGAIPEAEMNAAREYAAHQALKATFNDRNAFSDLISKRMRADKPFAKPINFVMDSILPFRRTPANIVVRIGEYSPAGLARGIWNFAKKVDSGQMDASTAIDQIAAGFTGTAAIGIGAALASGLFGIKLVGLSDDEDEKRTGRQSYALEIGDKSYTIDWAAPSNVPLFVGANLFNAWRSAGGEDVSKLTSTLDALSKTLEPMLELSMLSSLNDLIDSVKYAEGGDKIYSLVVSAATSYLMQGLPTIFGQFDQLSGDRKMVYKESTDPVIGQIQKIIGRASKKLPGDFYQTDYVDAWGRTDKTNAFEAIASPSYISKLNAEEADKEIIRLNEILDESVSPRTPDYEVSIDGDKRRLTGKEWSALAKEQGSLSLKLVNQLIKEKDYQKLSDSEKGKAIEDVYRYAREFARKKVLPDYKEFSEKWMEGIGGKEVKSILAGAIQESSGLSEARYKKAIDEGFSLTEMRKVSKNVSELLSGIDDVEDRDTYAAIIESVPKAQADKWLRTYGMSDSRIRNLHNVTDAGFTTDDFFDIWDAYKDVRNAGGKSSEQAMQWAVKLDNAVSRGDISKSQRKVLMDNFTFYTQLPVSAGKYDALRESGLSSDVSVQATEFMAGLTKTAERMKAIGKSNLSKSEQDKIAHVYLNDSQDEKYDKITAKGFTTEQYGKLYEIYAEGGKKAQKIAEFQKEFGLSYGQADWVYKVFSGR